MVSRNSQTRKTEIKRVLHTTIKHTDVVVSVRLADSRTSRVVDTITASREHPFYVAGKGFVPAGGLAVGNAIVTRAGPPLVVQSIKWNRTPDGYTVYNFVVDGNHTYFVGTHEGGVWVHNPPAYVFLDNNALSALASGGTEGASIRALIGSRTPLVGPSVAAEYAAWTGAPKTLADLLAEIGGREISVPPSAKNIANMVTAGANSAKRLKDAHAGASALDHGVPIISKDADLLKWIRRAGGAGETW